MIELISYGNDGLTDDQRADVDWLNATADVARRSNWLPTDVAGSDNDVDDNNVDDNDVDGNYVDPDDYRDLLFDRGLLLDD